MLAVVLLAQRRRLPPGTLARRLALAPVLLAVLLFGAMIALTMWSFVSLLIHPPQG